MKPKTVWQDTYCQFQDTVLVKGQDPSLNEGVAMLEPDLKLANRMGFTKMRLLIDTPIDVVKTALPLAEKYNVWMGWEVHAPANFQTPCFGLWVETIERNKTEILGIFSTRPARNMSEAMIGSAGRGETTPEIVKYIGDQRYAGVSCSHRGYS